MRRLELIIKIILVIFVLSNVANGYELFKNGLGENRLINLAISIGALIYSVVWLLQVRSQGSMVKPMTKAFMSIPIVASIFQVPYIWIEREDIVFGVIATIVMIVLPVIYYRLVFGWIKRLDTESAD